MDTISWQEVTVRLLFAFILGGATAIETKWYQTRKSIKSNTQIALGAAMFAMLTNLTSETTISSQLILGISIICAGILLQKQVEPPSINAAIKLWCAGSVGSLVGYGLFLPAYIGILAIILANLLFPVTEREFIPSLEEELHNDASSSLAEEKSNPEIAEQSIENIPQEVYYRCQVICPAENEIEVLALLVQLSKEQKLVVIGISTKKLANNQSLPEVEIEVDFVCDSNNNQSELEEVLYQLKSKVEVSASSWLCLSSQLPNINESGDYRQQTPAQAYSENQRFKV